MTPLNFVLAGVGGQGILLASDVLCQVGLSAGYDVKKTDSHGMSQRGGSVSSHVRFAAEVLSPLVAPGSAHYLLALERLEAVRWLPYLRPDGVVVVNEEAIPTLAALSASPRRPGRGGPPYPGAGRIAEALEARAARVVNLDAGRIALELGNARVANVVLLGRLSTLLPFPLEIWHQALEERVPPRHRDLNLRAFAAGRAGG